MVGGAQQQWLKITRTGSTLAGFVSRDGRQWELFGKVAISVSGTMYMGIGVCSHNQGRLNKVLFDQVETGEASKR